MNIDLALKISGLLGFIISIATFILTRLERRKRIEIELFHGYESEIEEYDTDSHSPEIQIIKVRFTNLGAKPVILKPSTLEIRSNGRISTISEYEYWGGEKFEELMPPMSKREIGLHLIETMKELDIKAPEKYDDESFNKKYPLYISVKDHEGTVFESKKYSYQESIGEFVT